MIMFTPIPRLHGVSRAEHGDRFSAHVLQAGHSQRKKSTNALAADQAVQVLGRGFGANDLLSTARQRGPRHAVEGDDGLSLSRSICSTSSASLSHSRAASSNALFLEGSFVRAARS